MVVQRLRPYTVNIFARMSALAASLGIADRISFLGHRTDLKEIMAVSTIVYSLSLDPEAFGRVSLEALALGKPVIGYDHGGVAEQLRVIFPLGLVNPGDLDCATPAFTENFTCLPSHSGSRTKRLFHLGESSSLSWTTASPLWVVVMVGAVMSFVSVRRESASRSMFSALALKSAGTSASHISAVICGYLLWLVSSAGG